ncbi:hypothetical protein E4T56_gene9944 [Termitomyces sp. T112]|nr:hypothetical protein E4T56_gene9944 [Termitomyces sp. T112]
MEKLAIDDVSSPVAKPSFASIANSIRHTTSKHTDRYRKNARASPQNSLIAAGLSSYETLPNYLPSQWSVHIHPEGQLYFFKDATIPVVTEAYVYDPNLMEKVERCIKAIEYFVLQKQIVLPDNVELFIQIEGNDCSYYLIDHHSHMQFWLDDLETNEMGIDMVTSPSHLGLALQELYWIHVEYFPTHLKSLAPRVLEDLIGVLSHALTDHLTSRNSTFPYDAGECTQILQLLRSFRDQRQDEYARCVIARMWQLVFKHRFETFYGEQHARLCRDQAILVDTARESCLFRIFTSLLSFKTSDNYVSHLNDIYVDHLVYAHQWQAFMAQSLREWRSFLYLSLLTPLCCLLFFFMPTLQLLSAFSALCFGTSFISSVLLIHRHEVLENATANDALNYLNGVRSDRFKFQWVALVYAFPKTFFLWGVIGYNSNCFVAAAVLIAGNVGWLPYFLALVGICLLAIIAFQDITSGNKVLRIPTFRWSRVDQELPPVSLV